MSVEIELKFKLDDPNVLRRRLQSLGAESRGAVFEENRLYDFADGRLRASDAVLRLRQEWAQAGGPLLGALLTFKRRLPALDAAGPKRCDELETRIENAAELDPILAGLGLTPRLAYEKRREKWKLADCAVVLDELPRIGWFVEIEAELEPQIAWACRELSLSGTGIADTYPSLTERHGALDANGARELRFAVGI